MRTLRLWLAGMGVVALLGCSGVATQLQQLTNTEVKTGADATMPEGFPLPPPEGGEIQTAVTMDLAGMHTSTVQYVVAGDVAPILDRYEQLMKDAGLATTRSTTGGTQSLTGIKGEAESWTVAVTDDQGKQTMSLVVVSR